MARVAPGEFLKLERTGTISESPRPIAALAASEGQRVQCRSSSTSPAPSMDATDEDGKTHAGDRGIAMESVL